MTPVSHPGSDSAPVRPLLVGLLGGECTGKTTLARDLVAELADERPVVSTPEALRDFVRGHDRPPRRGEQASIMAAQIANERAAMATVVAVSGRPAVARASTDDPASGEPAGIRIHPIVVCDPCALMTAIYSLAYFADSQLLTPALVHQRNYNLVLSCGTDLPWTPDEGQRDGPDRRAQVADLLAAVVRVEQLPVVAVAGDRPTRLKQALEQIHSLQR